MTKTPRSADEGALKPVPQWWKNQLIAWQAASEWSWDGLEKRLGIRPGSISKMLKKSTQSRLVDKLVAFTGIDDPSPVEPAAIEQHMLLLMRGAPSEDARRKAVAMVELMLGPAPAPDPKKTRK